MKNITLMLIFLIIAFQSKGQTTNKPQTSKKRLNFAKTYFELGGRYAPAFSGKRSIANQVQTFEHSATFNPYLSWGGFHFWGKAEFYVTFPLNQLRINHSEETNFEMNQSVVTGARFFPWRYREGRIRPYFGLSWSAMDFKQIIEPTDNQPSLVKDFLLIPDMGLLYGYKNFALRLGVNYTHENKWQYPITKTRFEKIETPKFNFQIGLMYAFENSHHKKPEVNEKWNNYPGFSKPSHSATRFGDFFIGVGPSSSFSLQKSTYNQQNFPYLRDQLSSNGYFDIAAGYQFNQANLFTALSFRNPSFETSGYETTQKIQKTSIALEINKYVTDYSGFAPYIGLNVAYDQIKYSEKTEQGSRERTYEKIEPGITFGWDIIPGKMDEALILRTNLRWYPLSSFNVEGQKFNFSQLEYNLIQLVFYPGRLLNNK